MKRNASCLIALLGLTANMPVYAAGYENPALWSGKWAALGGASVGAVVGADALVMNPAGLVEGSDRQVSINFSPLLTKFSGPLRPASPGVANGPQEDGEWVTLPSMGLLYKHALRPDFALGVGLYAAAGTSAEYRNIDFSGFNPSFSTLKPDAAGKIQDVEFSIGAGYRLTDNWSIGAAWRMSMVQAELSSAAILLDSVLVNVHFKDLEDRRYDGYRVGLQYRSSDRKWGAGLSWRSEVNFAVEGNSSGEHEHITLGFAPLENGGRVKVKNALPQTLSLGAFYSLNSPVTLFGEFRWGEYSVNDRYRISGEPLNLRSELGGFNVLTDLVQDWDDQYSLHMAVQYAHRSGWNLRSGFAAATQVVPDDNALALFTSPGKGYTFAMGVGKDFSEQLEFDIAFEYSWVSGSGESTFDPSGVQSQIAGDYELEGYVLHSSLKWRL